MTVMTTLSIHAKFLPLVCLWNWSPPSATPARWSQQKPHRCLRPTKSSSCDGMVTRGCWMSRWIWIWIWIWIWWWWWWWSSLSYHQASCYHRPTTYPTDKSSSKHFQFSMLGIHSKYIYIYIFLINTKKNKINLDAIVQTYMHVHMHTFYIEHIQPQKLMAGYQKWWALEKVAPFNMATFWFLC